MKFTRAELAAFHGAAVDDLIDDRVRLLFVGINPGLWTAAVNAHFARRGNRFWPALHAAGITPRLVDVSDGMSECRSRTGARARDRHHQHRSDGERPCRGVEPRRTARRRTCRSRQTCGVGSRESSPCSVSRRTGRRSPNRRPPRVDRTTASAVRSCGCCPTRAASTPTRPSTAWRRSYRRRGTRPRLTRGRTTH